MALKERSYSVLVVSSTENFHSAMAAMLPDMYFQQTVNVSTVAEAQRTVAERDFDFVIINAPLKEDFGIRFAIDCTSSHNSLVLFLVSNEIHAEVYSKVAEHGVFTLL